MDIVGKVAVVTGAGSGLGRAVAEDLARRGASTLALVDRSENVEQVTSLIHDSCNGRCHVDTYIGDVTCGDFRREVFDHVTREHGVPRICVPAAGITRDRLAVRLDRDTGQADVYPIGDFRLTVEVNLIAPIYWAMETVARIAQDRAANGLGRWTPEEPIQGTAIFIGSVSSQGNKGQIAYAATKAGLEGAAATLSKEAVFHGVRCAVIHPGFCDTPMVRALGEDYIRDRILPQTQLHRLIRPEEIADAICFMIQNPAVSGQLWADAGWHPSN